MYRVCVYHISVYADTVPIGELGLIIIITKRHPGKNPLEPSTVRKESPRTFHSQERIP